MAMVQLPQQWRTVGGCQNQLATRVLEDRLSCHCGNHALILHPVSQEYSSHRTTRDQRDIICFPLGPAESRTPLLESGPSSEFILPSVTVK